MLLKLSSPIARLAVVSLGVLCCAWLAYSSVRTARAAHEIELQTREGYEQAARLEPGNAENWYQLGRYWQYNLDDADAGTAVRLYRTALTLNQRDADIWMDLATAYESQGNIAGARDAFLQAKRAYPISAEVSWRYGNFLLRQNDIQRALPEISSAVYVEPKRSAEAVALCWRVYPDIQAILDNVLPADRDAYLDVIHELSVEGQLAAALIVWPRLVAIHPQFQMAEAIPFTSALIDKSLISDAQRVWKEALRLSNTPSPSDPAGSVVWDGGFESNVWGGGFAWNLPTESREVRVALDSTQKHSGRQSLRLNFNGRSNVNFEGVCNDAEVEPATTYRFTAWVRSQSLTTDQGVRFRLRWTQNGRAASVQTSNVLGTQPWTQIQMSWTSGADVRQVRICVAREPSTKFDSQIQGAAWLDDVALVPQSATPSNP